MVGQILLVTLSLLSSCHSVLVKCNGDVKKLQLCNLHKDEYDEGRPHYSPGHPTIIKPSVIVYKIADLDDQENTISLNFLLSIVWHDPRIGLEDNNPNKSNRWYEVNELDQAMIFTPTLEIGGTKTIVRTRKYGATDKDYFWFFQPDQMMIYEQSLKTRIYCSLDFKRFPFDSHNCDLNFGSSSVATIQLMLNASMITYQNQYVNYGEGLLQISQSRLPFDISLESLAPFEYSHLDGYNYSYTGIRIHFSRNTVALLIGGYYGPTIIFSMLSLVSYSIKSDIVSKKYLIHRVENSRTIA